MSLIGNIEPFNPDHADITTYIERIEQLFICNDVSEKKKVSLFLTLLGGEAYNILKDLLSPQLPSQKTYTTLKETLINHYNLKRLVIAERYKFYSINQDNSEDIKSYRTKLKNLSKYCKFEGFLDEALRDKFIFGLSSEQIKQRLLMEDDLTFKKACEIAIKMELTGCQRVMPRNDEENIVNQLENNRNDGKLNEETNRNKSIEYSTQANEESNNKMIPVRQICKRFTKVHKDYSAMNSRCVSCNQVDYTASKSPTSKNRAYNIENQEDKQNQEENNHIFELKFIDIDTIDTLEEARKKADSNYSSCDETRRHEKRIIHEKPFDDTLYDTCDDSIDEDCDSPSQLQTSYKKIKINENWESGKKSLDDKQFLHKKQLSSNKVSQIVALSTPKHSLYDKSQTQIVDPLQIVQMDECNESSEFGPQEINVQNLEFISTTAPSATVSDIEKLIPLCEETLMYVKSIDRRLRVLERGVVNEEEPEGMNVFDNILPINSIQTLKQFEESIETSEIKTKFMEFMKRIGGKGNKNMIQRCMSRLFTNEFGISCSWCGRGNNYRMCDLKCIQVLKIVLRARGINECEFETIASEWFRLSKLRYDRENKKVLPTDDCDTQEKET